MSDIPQVNFVVSEAFSLVQRTFWVKILPLLGSGRTNVVNATARASYDTWRLKHENLGDVRWVRKNWVSLHPEKKNAINHGS